MSYGADGVDAADSSNSAEYVDTFNASFTVGAERQLL